ncbi:hypothetical protein CLIB1423_35S00364 [[Candida] railenensis]|uniref:Uncharacterized protein n=1 Tax=[Candida] railenensis TaxID=45579 RepID=A0A9P0QWY7_9ASCO|nr:hypothetical protein CLIB1423_35S00364 [[Candida] railenensis]
MRSPEYSLSIPFLTQLKSSYTSNTMFGLSGFKFTYFSLFSPLSSFSSTSLTLRISRSVYRPYQFCTIFHHTKFSVQKIFLSESGRVHPKYLGYIFTYSTSVVAYWQARLKQLTPHIIREPVAIILYNSYNRRSKS